MKLKFFRMALIGCLLVTALFTGGAVYADDNEGTTDLGITPDSPFYFLDKWGKGIGMAFTFGDEAKAKKALKYGEERLAEAEQMAKKDRIREMDRAAEEYEGYMEMVNERVENGGLSDNITETVCNATSRHLEIMERIRERIQERAGDAIDNAENMSMNGQINALRALAKNRIQRAAELATEAANRNMERFKSRCSDNTTSGNNTGDMEICLNYLERIEALEDELIAKAEELGIDVTPLLERLSQSTQNRLEALSEVWEKAPENARHGIENAMENSVRKYERAREQLRVRENRTDDETGPDIATDDNGKPVDDILEENDKGNDDNDNGRDNGEENGQGEKDQKDNGRNGK